MAIRKEIYSSKLVLIDVVSGSPEVTESRVKKFLFFCDPIRPLVHCPIELHQSIKSETNNKKKGGITRPTFVIICIWKNNMMF